jgi:hypothetical protein
VLNRNFACRMFRKKYRDSDPCKATVHNIVTKLSSMNSVKIKKTILVTGRGGPYGCETSRLSQFLDNRITDGGKVISLTRRPPFTPRKILGTHFCKRLSLPQGHSAAGRIRSIEYLIGSRTRSFVQDTNKTGGKNTY